MVALVFSAAVWGATFGTVVPIDIPLGGHVADIVLDDSSVSRRHALVTKRGDTTVILDDRSLNGVQVNGTRVSEAALKDGDVVLVGHVTLRYIERA